MIIANSALRASLAPRARGIIVKRECPRRTRENKKMWHMLEISISLIFRLVISLDELINVVYLFRSDLLLFSRKFAKTVQDADHFKHGEH